MDDDDLGWQWPAWKFGMKRDDLFTKLHDQYNTLPTPIQDPEAFHHDVYEISTLASSKDEFHRLMADRKQQRLDELNRGLESASVEIIANPTLIGTEQWQYALQLFRARSLDSLVRYFSSYLPESHPWHSDVETDTESNSVRSDISSNASSMSSTDTDVNPDDVPATTIYLTDKVTHEPFPISTNVSFKVPLSPPSSAADDDSTVVSPTDLESHHDYLINHPTPSSRSMSFSGSESGRFCPHGLPRFEECDEECDDDEDSEASEDPATPSTEMTDLDFVPISHDKDACDESDDSHDTQSDAAAIAHPHSPCQSHDTCDYTDGVDEDANTSTPRPLLSSHETSYITAKLSQQTRRSPSPSPKNRDQRRCPRTKRREATPPQVARSPCELLSRIQKPLPDMMRTKLTARRRTPTATGL